MKLTTNLSFFCLPFLFGCAQLEAEPWSRIGKGTKNIGLSTGWADYGAELEATGKSGVLVPGGIPETGTDQTDLKPRYGGAVKVNYFVTDKISLGGIFEIRSFDADSVSPLTAELEPDTFETTHYLFTTRYFADPIDENRRVRPFFGFDVGYVPEVKFDKVEVTFDPASGIPPERLNNVKGDSYWTVAPVGGFTFLIRDNLSFDVGAFYEWAVTSSDATIELANLGGAEADVEVWPEGLVVFVGMTFYF